MLFAAPTVVYLRKQSLEIYHPKLDPGVLEFPLTQYRFLEVISPEEFKNSIIDFLGSLKLHKHRVAIALSAEVTFEKQFEYPALPPDKKEKEALEEAQKQATEELNKSVEQFINSVPLEDIQKGIKRLPSATGEMAIVFNKETADHLQQALESFEPEIESIVPASLLGVEPHQGFLSPQELGLLTQNNKLTKEINLMDIVSVKAPSTTESPILDEDELEEKHASNRNKWILGVMVVLFTAIGIAYYFWGETMRPKILPRIFKQVASSSAVPVAMTPGPSAQATLSATLDKAVIEIRVLNGSGVSGQAAKVEEILKDLGYLQIETGNATASARETVVNFSPVIPKFERGEIINSLSSIYLIINEQETARNQGSDVLITVGTLK